MRHYLIEMNLAALQKEGAAKLIVEAKTIQAAIRYAAAKVMTVRKAEGKDIVDAMRAGVPVETATGETDASETDDIPL